MSSIVSWSTNLARMLIVLQSNLMERTFVARQSELLLTTMCVHLPYF